MQLASGICVHRVPDIRAIERNDGDGTTRMHLDGWFHAGH
jgi:hypothetical protein